MKELMLSSIGRRVEYQFESDGTVTRSDGGSYQMFGDHFKRGNKTYYFPSSPYYASLLPSMGILNNVDIPVISVAPDHIEYYLTGNSDKVRDLLVKAGEVGHTVEYPNGDIMPSITFPGRPALSFRYVGDTLVEVSIYIAVGPVRMRDSVSYAPPSTSVIVGSI